MRRPRASRAGANACTRAFAARSAADERAANLVDPIIRGLISAVHSVDSLIARTMFVSGIATVNQMTKRLRDFAQRIVKRIQIFFFARDSLGIEALDLL